MVEESRVRSEGMGENRAVEDGGPRTYITFFILFVLGLLVSKTFLC